MTEVIGVKFRTAGKVYYFSPKGMSFSRGEYAIVETSRGVEYGEVLLENEEVPDEKIEINVNKTWEDNNNASNKRPTSIKYVLSGNNQTQEQVVSGNRTTDANWNYKFTNLPKYNAQGNEITYTVEEQEVNANDLKFYTKKVSGEQTNGFAVINKFTVPTEKVTVKVSKTWDDESNRAKYKSETKIQQMDGAITSN